MATRNRIREIIEKKGRGPKNASTFHLEFRRLEKQWREIQHVEAVPADFFPIRAVTLLEVFARGWIATLIDHGTPYSERVSKLGLELKYDLEIVRAIHGQTITLGEFIAHNVRVNSFPDVFECFNVLIGQELLDLIKSAVDRSMSLGDLMRPAEGKATIRKPIIDDVDAMRRVLCRLFQVRHILCHEFPRTEVYDQRDVTGFLTAAYEFAHATDEALHLLLFGESPFDIAEFLRRAQQTLDASESEMRSIMQRIRDESNPERIGLIDKAEAAWQEYRSVECELLSHGDGTIATRYFRLTYADTLTKARIEVLKQYLGEP